MMTEIQCELEQLPGRIIFLSVYNDIVWREKGNRSNCIANSFILMSRIGSNRRGADGVRAEKFPRIHCFADCRRDSKHDD